MQTEPSGNVFLYITFNGVHLSADASFARLPAVGDHVLLWLTAEQRALLGNEVTEPATALLVRDVALRQIGKGTQKYVADVFAEAIHRDEWLLKMAHFGSAGEDYV
jgi:hypothetical protein